MILFRSPFVDSSLTLPHHVRIAKRSKTLVFNLSGRVIQLKKRLNVIWRLFRFLV